LSIRTADEMWTLRKSRVYFELSRARREIPLAKASARVKGTWSSNIAETVAQARRFRRPSSTAPDRGPPTAVPDQRN